jgi:hypothetical protein
MDEYKPLENHPYDNNFPHHLLEVFESPYEKIRIGRDGDGGYVIVKLPKKKAKYDLLLGCGIDDDLSFEYDLLNLYPNLTADVFDGSISQLPNKYNDNPKIRFHKQYISNDIKSSPNRTDLREYLQNHKNIFLKMDIEGSEFDWFNCLTLDEINHFKQIVIELHKPFYPERCKTLETLRKTHYLVHLNGNNTFPPVKLGNQLFPKFIEACFLRKDMFDEIPQLSNQPIPSNIDKKNRLSKPWIVLRGYPYNNL